MITDKIMSATTKKVEQSKGMESQPLPRHPHRLLAPVCLRGEVRISNQLNAEPPEVDNGAMEREFEGMSALSVDGDPMLLGCDSVYFAQNAMSGWTMYIPGVSSSVSSERV